jgi:hypothetical protein
LIDKSTLLFKKMILSKDGSDVFEEMQELTPKIIKLVNDAKDHIRSS